MKSLSTVLCLILAALVAVVGWFAFQQKSSATSALAELERLKTSSEDAGIGERGAFEAEIARLKTELAAAKAESSLPAAAPTAQTDTGSDLANLQAQLRAKEAEIARLKTSSGSKPTDAAAADNGPELSREERRAQELARMKQEQPQEYQEMIQRRVQSRVEMKQGMDERLKFYRDFDLTGLPDETVQRHGELLKRLETMSSAFAAMAANPEGAQPDFGDLREQMGDVGDIMREQRGILMQDLASDLGLQGKDSDQLVETIDYIREMTTPPRPNFGGRGGRGGGGPGGGGR